MRIVAYKIYKLDNGVCIEESTGEEVVSDNVYKLLDFLCEPFQTKDEVAEEGVQVIKICWDLNATIAPLLKLLGKDNCRKLHETKRLKVDAYSLFYVPDKIFCAKLIPPVKRGDDLFQLECKLYDLSQYYPDIEQSPSVIELQELGKDLLKTLSKMYLKTTKLTSPIAIYEDAILSKMNLPKITDIPKPVAEYAYQCSRRLWIESYKMGYFKNAMSLDIVSSFPSVAKELIDVRQCDWINTVEWHPEAAYGYCNGRVTIYDDVQVSPIIYRDENCELCTPTGTWETILTKQEIEFINKWNIGKFEIYDAWWGIPNVKIPRKPLKLILESLLQYKAKGGLQTLLAKRCSVGIYGLQGQEMTYEVGEYWNPVWFAEISTQIRLKDAEFIYQNNIQKNLIHIGVDGIVIDTIIPAQGDAVGQWKLAGISDCLSVSSGLCYMDDKKPKGLYLKDILEMIKEHPNINIYTKTLKKVVTLGDALNSNFEQLGEYRDTYSTLNLITLQHDRVFRKAPLTGNQLLKNIYESEARHVEVKNDIKIESVV